MKNVEKYAKLYMSLGFDVISNRISVPQFLCPSRIENSFKKDLLPILLSSEHAKKLIHGFSVGVYSYGRILKNLELSKDPRKEEFIKSIKAQIWDSPGNRATVAIGLTQSMLPNWPKFLQKHVALNIADAYLNSFGGIPYHVEASKYFIEKPLRVPALFFASEMDPIANTKVIHKYIESWERLGIPCEENVWSDTAHVSHFVKYPEEYKRIVKTFLTQNGFTLDTDKVADFDYCGNENSFVQRMM